MAGILAEELRDEFLEVRSGNHALIVKGRVYKRVEDALKWESSDDVSEERQGREYDALRKELLI